VWPTTITLKTNCKRETGKTYSSNRQYNFKKRLQNKVTSTVTTCQELYNSCTWIIHRHYHCLQSLLFICCILKTHKLITTLYSPQNNITKITLTFISVRKNFRWILQNNFSSQCNVSSQNSYLPVNYHYL